MTLLKDAVNTWPTTATSVVVRKKSERYWKIYAPFGLKELCLITGRLQKRYII